MTSASSSHQPSSAEPGGPPPISLWRATVVAAVWLATYQMLSRYAVFALPIEVARQTTLTQYLLAVHCATLVCGATLVALFVRDEGTRHAILPLWRKPSSTRVKERTLGSSVGAHASWMVSLLLGPLLYLIAHLVGMYFARDLLLQELAAKGAQAVQQQTGELGRVAREDALLWVVPFTVLIAPLSEELLFRGALWEAASGWLRRQSATRRSSKLRVANDSGRESVQIPGMRQLPPAVFKPLGWLRSEGLPLLVSAAVFAALHADMPGGLGRMRWVSALVLGLGCGLARGRFGWLLPAVVLHAAYNLVSLGTLRGYWVIEGWRTWYALPTLLFPISAASTCAALLVLWWGRRSSRSCGR